MTTLRPELTEMFDNAATQDKKQLLYVLTHEDEIEDITPEEQAAFIDYIKTWWETSGRPSGFEFLTKTQRQAEAREFEHYMSR